MDSLIAAVALPEADDAGPQRLTVRDRLAMAVMVSGGWWMALIFTAIAPVLSTMSDQLGGAKNGYWIGQLTMTIPDIGIIVGGPIAGLLVERYSARMLLFASFALYAVAGGAGMIVDDGTSMLSTRLLVGLSGAGIATSTTALIGNRFEGATRVRALAMWSGFGALGGFLSAMIAGWVANWGGGWHAPFSLYGLAAVPLIMALFVLPTRKRPAATKAEKVAVPSIRHLWPLYAGMIPVYVAVFMTGVQLSFLLGADRISDPVTQSWVIATASAGSILGALSFAFLRPRLGTRGTMMIFIALMAAGNLIMPLTANPVIMAIGAALNGAGGGMANPYFAAVLIDRAPVAARGRAIGLLYTTQFFGEFMNPFVVTPLAGLLGIHGAFFAVSALLIAGVVGVTLYRGRTAG
ncbi:MAG TPA: MFS transporter [Alphaproteobacteria bacterium]|jgi:MFS family permease|nr:MFS transporter [Alphaproteobacteria bacterium]